MIKKIYDKEILLALIIKSNFYPDKTTFITEDQHILQMGYIVYPSSHKIPPHLHKEECDRLVQENLIYGCGKPFQLISKQENNITYWSAIKCGYI